MKRRVPALAAAAALMAAAPALAQGGSYRAHGTEPFWGVTVDPERMVFTDPDGGRISVRTPLARPSINGRRYVTRRLTVDITRQTCSDGMSDLDYADTVRVTVGSRVLNGCGGAILRPASLAHTSWRIQRIGMEDVSRLEGYELDFGPDRLNGRAGCNRFGGGYRVSRDGFQAGPLAMTRMACPQPGMRHEQLVSRILSGRVRLHYPDGQTLIMRGAAGEIRLRRN